MPVVRDCGSTPLPAVASSTTEVPLFWITPPNLGERVPSPCGEEDPPSSDAAASDAGLAGPIPSEKASPSIPSKRSLRTSMGDWLAGACIQPPVPPFWDSCSTSIAPTPSMSWTRSCIVKPPAKPSAESMTRGSNSSRLCRPDMGAFSGDLGIILTPRIAFIYPFLNFYNPLYSSFFGVLLGFWQDCGSLSGPTRVERRVAAGLYAPGNHHRREPLPPPFSRQPGCPSD